MNPGQGGGGGTAGAALVGAAVWLAGLVAGAGCAPAVPAAEDPPAAPQRDSIASLPDAVLYREAGVDDALWLAMDRPAEAGGPLGGYFTRPDAGRAALVLVLEGANPGWADARLPHTLTTHRSLSASFGEAGLTAWTPLVRECGTPYGQDDLADVLAAIDWLQGGGLAALGCERLYVVGYSKGATLATLANMRRVVTACVSLNGLCQPDQFERNWLFYQALVTVWYANEGFCQLKTTLEAYGPPGSPGWAVLDCVSRIGDLAAPELFIHAMLDPVYQVQNTQAMEARYEAGVAAGEPLVPLDFLYVEDGGHYVVRKDPAIHQQIVDYLNRFEPR